MKRGQSFCARHLNIFCHYNQFLFFLHFLCLWPSVKRIGEVMVFLPQGGINAQTHTQTPTPTQCNLTLAAPRHVEGMSPPSVAENNQIILSGDTSDGARSPLLRLRLSVCLSVCLRWTPSHPVQLPLPTIIRRTITHRKENYLQTFDDSNTRIMILLLLLVIIMIVIIHLQGTFQGSKTWLKFDKQSGVKTRYFGVITWWLTQLESDSFNMKFLVMVLLGSCTLQLSLDLTFYCLSQGNVEGRGRFFVASSLHSPALIPCNRPFY